MFPFGFFWFVGSTGLDLDHDDGVEESIRPEAANGEGLKSIPVQSGP